MRRLTLLISSGLGTGYIPFASGTWATALAILFYWPMAGWNRLPSQGGNLWIYGGIIAAVSALGTWAADYAEKLYQEKDPHRVVIDEIAGYFVSMTLLPFHWGWLVAAFFVFRLFDVWKPYPIRQLQQLPGGVGIMIDDLLAGVYTCVVLHVAKIWVPGGPAI